MGPEDFVPPLCFAFAVRAIRIFPPFGAPYVIIAGQNINTAQHMCVTTTQPKRLF